MKFIFFIFLIAKGFVFSDDYKTIQFISGDSLIVTADLYMPNSAEAPFLILFHQAGWSRGEYTETAMKLNNMGYNCIAVDLRAGGEINDVKNETHREAVKRQLATGYIDALPDMESALKTVKLKYNPPKTIVFGSSYSASLALVLAAKYPDLIDGVVAFSPAEYFKRNGKSPDFIKDHAKSVKCPVLITSAKAEKNAWADIFEVLPSALKMSFLPESKGNHGSRSLWTIYDDSIYYWKALSKFLLTNYPVPLN